MLLRFFETRPEKFSAFLLHAADIFLHRLKMR